MKSEHRHELETNVLSARLARAIDGLKPFTGQIITGFVLLAVMYLGLSVWDSQSNQREQAAWDAFALENDVSDPEMKGLQRIAGDEQYAGTRMQEWAYVAWCDRQVLNAMQTSLYDREATNDRLRSVSGIYENLATSAGDPQVLNRARFGLGRVYELQNKIEEAREQYARVSGELKTLASDRSEQLKSEAVRDASSWLATAELPRRDLTGGQGATGERPEFQAGLPAADADAINPKSLEELLGEFKEEALEENRYGEEVIPTAEDTPEDSTEDTTGAATKEDSAKEETAKDVSAGSEDSPTSEAEDPSGVAPAADADSADAAKGSTEVVEGSTEVVKGSTEAVEGSTEVVKGEGADAPQE